MGQVKARLRNIFETVLSSRYKIEILKKAKESGYRYYKALANIPQLMELCDILHIYDNTITPVRIVRKHKDDISIFPNDLWSESKIIELIGE